MRVTHIVAENIPQDSIEKVGSNKYFCRICDNVELTDNGYDFDSYRGQFLASSYQELLINIIHTRYSYDDETNLINDFLLEGDNPKYKKYRDFVAWAKIKAKSFFEEG